MSVERQPHWPERIGYKAAFLAGFKAQRGDVNPWAKSEYTWEEPNGLCRHHFGDEVSGWEDGWNWRIDGNAPPVWR